MAERLKSNPNLVTILPNTPNAHTFYFKDSQNPTKEELNQVREYYGIPLDVSAQEASDMLNALGQQTSANIISDIPYAPNTKEYYAEIAQRVADINQRKALIGDPANYYFKQLQKKVPGLDPLVPDALVSKGSFEMMGSLAGMTAAGVAAAPAGPLAQTGAILGADVLGSQAGGYLYEYTNQLLRYLNDLPQESQEEQINKFLKDAYLNLAFSGGSMVMGPIVKNFKPAVGRVLFGLDNKNPEYQKMIEVAETYGMPLGIIQATNSSFWKGYSEVLGVFPYVGTPFRRSQEGANEAIRQYFDTATKNFAPLQTMASLGGDLAKLAEAGYDDTMTISRALYQDFEAYAEKLAGKKVIKVDTVKRLADDFAKNLRSAQPPAGGYEFKFPGANSERLFTEFYESLSRLDRDGITIQQARNLLDKFSNFQNSYKIEGKGIVPKTEGPRITQLQLALESDLSRLVALDDDIDKVVFETALNKLTTANDYLSAVMPKFDNPIADQYKLVNASIFAPGAPGKAVIGNAQLLDNLVGMARKDEDLMKAIMNLAETPKANLDAYKAAGGKEGVTKKVKVQRLDDEPYLPNGDENPNFGKTITTTEEVVSMAPNAGRKKILRHLYDQALEESFSGLPVAATLGDYKNLKGLNPEQLAKYGYKGGVSQNAQDLFKFRTVQFDPQVFAEKLGLNTVEGRAVLDVAFEGTGVGAKDITRFLEVAERAGSFVVRDPAQFVTRRVTLGGFKSLLLFGLGSGAAGFFGAGLAPLMVPFMLRYGSSILTDPKVLKSFSKALESTGAETARRTGVAKAVFSKEDQQVLLDWANKTLPTEDEVQQMEFVNRVEESILSLMKTPQLPIEQKSAREEQLDIMSQMGKTQTMKPEDFETGRMLEDRLAPTFPAAVTDPYSFMEQEIGFQEMNPQTRSNLAFGTVDDALESQYGSGGIGGL
jgi:hypothetical protein